MYVGCSAMCEETRLVACIDSPIKSKISGNLKEFVYQQLKIKAIIF